MNMNVVIIGFIIILSLIGTILFVLDSVLMALSKFNLVLERSGQEYVLYRSRLLQWVRIGKICLRNGRYKGYLENTEGNLQWFKDYVKFDTVYRIEIQDKRRRQYFFKCLEGSVWLLSDRPNENDSNRTLVTSGLFDESFGVFNVSSKLRILLHSLTRRRAITHLSIKVQEYQQGQRTPGSYPWGTRSYNPPYRPLEKKDPVEFFETMEV